MSIWDSGLPPLDTHAHISPNVTQGQVASLGGAQVFAMTRDLVEAVAVLKRTDDSITWGCGVHPASSDALDVFTPERFRAVIGRFSVVGEVGLDGRAGGRGRQRDVFRHVLEASAPEPVLLSIHTAGAVDSALDELSLRPHPGAILHWFLGTSDQARRAAKVGCYFSVNAAMSDNLLGALPSDRVLPETDYPAARRRGGGDRPGDVTALEIRLGGVWAVDPSEARARLYRNLRDVASSSGAIERLPERLGDLLVVA